MEIINRYNNIMNKLIAEFMGWTPCDPNDSSMYANPHDKSDAWSTDEMRFNESWDWLMPVHKKCMFTPNFSGDDQLRTLLIDAVIDADINRLYDAVAEFIKQYNDERQ